MAEAVAAKPAAQHGSWVAPVAVGAGALAACATVAIADPSSPGRYGFCPFLAMTGQWCPLCGGLRAVHHLANGSLVTAVGYNLLVVAALPFAVWLWLAWFGQRSGRWRLRTPSWSAVQVTGVLGLMVVFGVLRNLAAFSVLAP